MFCWCSGLMFSHSHTTDKSIPLVHSPYTFSSWPSYPCHRCPGNHFGGRDFCIISVLSHVMNVKVHAVSVMIVYLLWLRRCCILGFPTTRLYGMHSIRITDCADGNFLSFFWCRSPIMIINLIICVLAAWHVSESVDENRNFKVWKTAQKHP